MNIEKLRESIVAEKQRSAWDKGVTQYALELVDELAEQINGGYVDPTELLKPRALWAAFFRVHGYQVLLNECLGMGG